MEPEVKLRHETEEGQQDVFMAKHGGGCVAQAMGLGIKIYPSPGDRKCWSFNPKRAAELRDWITRQLEAPPAPPVTTKHVIYLDLEWEAGEELPDDLQRWVEGLVCRAVDHDSLGTVAAISRPSGDSRPTWPPHWLPNDDDDDDED